ncbi:helix-turn-helix domain-containing protein [Acidianus sulfidivorans JP7]|uniref:helix-turn-helix domain-containing protein n=1 Tax=Acidianus sulfidivorans TaxID=312539 RepID=UPI0014431DC9|nr:helix-turn-helix domain-containing protein [Acidianus sulfidivorans]QIJ32894.1 helix-turn-helix domain-containing protein [Acidianus sulfidivorans JP7]
MVITLENVVRLVEDEGLDYSIIKYPEKTRKSIDIITTTKDNRKILVKTSTERINKDEITDLKKFSSIIGGIPLVITEETEEDIAIDKGSVFAISLEGFERLLAGEKIYIYRTRGGMFVKIRHDVLKRKREELNYSMGDLAKMLGVTRKTIYDYENGESDVSIEIAEKLIDIFGSEIIGDIYEDTKLDLNTTEQKVEDHRVLRVLTSLGFRAALLKLTAIDVVASNDKNKIVIAIEPKKQDYVEKKIQEANKIACDFNLKLIIVARSVAKAKELEKNGFQVYLDQQIDSLKDEFKEN